MSVKFEIFISHDTSDETLALLLKKLVEGIFLNSEVFVSGRDLRGGNLWIEEIRKRLRSAKVIISLITRGSAENPWVLFESGAGFTEDKTIPICADGISIGKLEPPLKLLHAHNFDEAGLKRLIQDIAKIAKLREPDVYSGLDKTLSEADIFINLRNSETAKPAVAQSPPANSKSTTSETVGKFLAIPPKDTEIQSRYEALEARYRNLVTKKIQAVRTSYEVPPDAQLNKMDASELMEVIHAYQIPFPSLLAVNITILGISLPEAADSRWRKMNVIQQIQSFENDLEKLEKAT